MTLNKKKIIWRNVLLFSLGYFAAFYTGMHIAFIRYFDVVNLLANNPFIVPMRHPAWDASELHSVSDVITVPFNYGLVGLAFSFIISLFRLWPIRYHWKEPLVALLASFILIFPSKWQFFIKPNVWTPASLFENEVYSYVANGTVLLSIAILSFAFARKIKQQHSKFDFEANAPNSGLSNSGRKNII